MVLLNVRTHMSHKKLLILTYICDMCHALYNYIAQSAGWYKTLKSHTHGCKLHMEAWWPFTSDLTFYLYSRILKWNAFLL